ncbi:MAG: hypothetical protein WC269_05400 [Candidatus Gracilibacteria bacterium]|jgi:hypothetical protein
MDPEEFDLELNLNGEGENEGLPFPSDEDSARDEIDQGKQIKREVRKRIFID